MNQNVARVIRTVIGLDYTMFLGWCQWISMQFKLKNISALPIQHLRDIPSYVLTCYTFNINVVTSPVGCVPEFSCCGVNFCRQTNPNFAWKIKLYGGQKMAIFELHTYTFQRKICVRLLFWRREVTF